MTIKGMADEGRRTGGNSSRDETHTKKREEKKERLLGRGGKDYKLNGTTAKM